jgi:protein SCO1/2
MRFEMKRKYLILIILFLVPLFQVFSADQKKVEIGVVENLGSYIPLNTELIDENGNKFLLKDNFDKPVVINFVYYECPGICSPLLTELASVLGKAGLALGVDYKVFTISMDASEDHNLATSKKQNYLKMMKKQIDPSSWRFLTGDSVTVKKLADAIGFYYKKEGDEFIHSAMLSFISSDGKICRYLYPDFTRREEFSILPFDFKMAVLEASEGTPTPTIARVIKFCFRYDPEGKTYVFNLLKVFGGGILLLTIILVVYLSVKPRKEKVENR